MNLPYGFSFRELFLGLREHLGSLGLASAAAEVGGVVGRGSVVLQK